MSSECILTPAKTTNTPLQCVKTKEELYDKAIKLIGGVPSGQFFDYILTYKKMISTDIDGITSNAVAAHTELQAFNIDFTRSSMCPGSDELLLETIDHMPNEQSAEYCYYFAPHICENTDGIHIHGEV